MKLAVSIKRGVEDDFCVPTVLVATVTDVNTGEPLASHNVHLEIAGDGSLGSGQLVRSRNEMTDDSGMILVAWWEYPNYSPRKELHSEVSVSCDEATVRIETMTGHSITRT